MIVNQNPLNAPLVVSRSKTDSKETTISRTKTEHVLVLWHRHAFTYTENRADFTVSILTAYHQEPNLLMERRISSQRDHSTNTALFHITQTWQCLTCAQCALKSFPIWTCCNVTSRRNTKPGLLVQRVVLWWRPCKVWSSTRLFIPVRNHLVVPNVTSRLQVKVHCRLTRRGSIVKSTAGHMCVTFAAKVSFPHWISRSIYLVILTSNGSAVKYVDVNSRTTHATGVTCFVCMDKRTRVIFVARMCLHPWDLRPTRRRLTEFCFNRILVYIQKYY